MSNAAPVIVGVLAVAAGLVGLGYLSRLARRGRPEPNPEQRPVIHAEVFYDDDQPAFDQPYQVDEGR
jgi:hypothetical protein